MASIQDRVITNATEDELRNALLKSLGYASEFTTLFLVVANNIAKTRGEASFMPPGAVVFKETSTGFAIGERELNSAMKGRVQDHMNELWRLGYVIPGVDALNPNFPNYRLSDRGKKLINTGHWPSDEPKAQIGNSLTITPIVFTIPGIPIEPDLVAVMMPFDKAFDATLSAILSACIGCGLKGQRVDSIWENYAIINDIFSLIYRSQIVIVDFSAKNSNVMYETGIAHTLGRHVIPISQSIDDVPFDMRHHRVLKYLPNSEGFSELKEKLVEKLTQLKAK